VELVFEGGGQDEFPLEYLHMANLESLSDDKIAGMVSRRPKLMAAHMYSGPQTLSPHEVKEIACKVE